MDKSIRTCAHPNCPICGMHGELLFPQLHDRLFGAQGEWNISRCMSVDCGLLWLDPRPLEEDIYKAYATYYTHTSHKGLRPLRLRFLSTILRFVVSVVTALSGLTKERRNVTNMHLNELSPGRLLEIGCGDGEFLDRMKGCGWTVDGVDFDEEAAKSAKEKFGIEVKVGQLEEMCYRENSFDAITLRHVLEHVFDPIATMHEVCRILKPGGTVIVVTPNAESLGMRTFGSNWRGLEPPRHIHIFTINALGFVAEKAGLEIVRSYSTAVHAWSIFSASFLLEKKSEYTQFSSRSSIRMILSALVMHYREARLNNGAKREGEECVLLARKNIQINNCTVFDKAEN